ncbi:MAG: hypothetical protein Q8L14_14180 [Myxococcales bacterium]|nr:hypothetical protein [Myxococcales bacterium]
MSIRVALVALVLVPGLVVAELPDAGMVYSGVVLSASGLPSTAPSEPIGLNIFRAQVGGQLVCQMPQRSVQLTAGRFTFPLDSSCNAPLIANSNAFLEFIIGPTTLPRVPITAVPAAARAVEASRHVVVSDAGVRSSIGGLWCGNSAPRNGKFGVAPGPVGLRAAKAICQATCSNSLTAHMCSADEALRSWELGLEPGIGWVKGLFGAIYSQGGAQVQSLDCEGWTQDMKMPNGYNYMGTTFEVPTGSTARINGNFCDAQQAILCCD